MNSVLILDAPYIISQSKKYGKYDAIKLAKRLEVASGHQFDEMYYFDAACSPVFEKTTGFYTWLEKREDLPRVTVKNYQRSPYTMCCPNCSTTFGKHVRTTMTLGIATLLVSSAANHSFDNYTICSGIAGLGEPIEFVSKSPQCNVTVCGFRGTVAVSLLGDDNSIIWLDDIWDDVHPN